MSEASADLPALEAESTALGRKPPRKRARCRFQPARLKLSAIDPTRKLNTASLHDQLVARLREMVLQGELRPGSPLPERMLCDTFGVSRTPLREGFKVLASEGLIELRPHRTPVVASVDPREIAASFEVIVALDHLAGRLACAHADDNDLARLDAMHARLVAFHAAGARGDYFKQNQAIHGEITRLARNPVLMATWSALSAKIYRARAQANYDGNRWRESLAEHEAFMGLLRQRNAAGFAQALAEHTRRTGNVVLATLASLERGSAT